MSKEWTFWDALLNRNPEWNEDDDDEEEEQDEKEDEE